MSSSTGNSAACSASAERKNGRSAFVYGTLMVPQIFHRVCQRNENPHPDLVSHLKFAPALLRNYSRRKVRSADYPGIIAQPAHTVLGTLISGLNDTDVRRLDFFEGPMYERVVVNVEVLEAEVFDKNGNINEAEMEKAKVSNEDERKMVKADTYVWCLSDGIQEEEWSYADFRREKLKDWVDGPENDGTHDYYSDSGTEEGSQKSDGESVPAKIETEQSSGGGINGDEDDVEQEKRRIASVVAGIAAQEAEADEPKIA